ncbi:ribosome-assembly protein 3-domain-containing protein [Xylaria palmicola]|nr:ribosome-assembly protein 3-domain-containing protein [Xylaria palmicola]
MTGKDQDATAAAAFTAYYLQQSTKEFAEDLDKIRGADDFKGGAALPMLIRSLQQGTSMFAAADQQRIAGAGEARKAGGSDEDCLFDFTCHSLAQPLSSPTQSFSPLPYHSVVLVVALAADFIMSVEGETVSLRAQARLLCLGTVGLQEAAEQEEENRKHACESG